MSAPRPKRSTSTSFFFSGNGDVTGKRTRDESETAPRRRAKPSVSAQAPKQPRVQGGAHFTENPSVVAAREGNEKQFKNYLDNVSVGGGTPSTAALPPPKASGMAGSKSGKHFLRVVLFGGEGVCQICRTKVKAGSGNQRRHYNTNHEAVLQDVETFVSAKSPSTEVLKEYFESRHCAKTADIRKFATKTSMRHRSVQEEAEIKGMTSLVAFLLSLADNGHSFAHVDNPAKRAFWSSVGLDPPSATTFRRLLCDVVALIQDEKGKGAAGVAGAVTKRAFTTDGWTHRGKSFVCVTQHFIDAAWNMRSTLVALVDTLDFPHNSATMAALFTKLVETRCPDSEVFAVTTDNASPALALGDLVSGGSGFGCVLHLLSKAIKTDLFGEGRTDAYELTDAASYFDKIFTRIRNLCAFFNRHNLNGELENVQKVTFGVPGGHVRRLQRDNDTRWWSKLAMVESIVELLPALREMAGRGSLRFDDLDEIPREVLYETEVAELRSFTTVMAPIRSLTRFLEADQHVTISLACPILKRVMEMLTEAADSRATAANMRVLAKELCEALEHRFRDMMCGSSWATMASLFAPVRGVPNLGWIGDDARSAVRDDLFDRFAKEALASVGEQGRAGAEVAEPVAVHYGDDDSLDAHGEAGGDDVSLKEIVRNANGAVRHMAFFTDLNVAVANDGVDRIARFWAKVEQHRISTISPFPELPPHLWGHLVSFATALNGALMQTLKGLLSLPASSAPSEREFSAAKLIDDGRGLGSENLERLALLRSRAREFARLYDGSDQMAYKTYATKLATRLVDNRSSD